ncbi:MULTISPECIES: hypothetical protein [Xanthomonas]|uniref:hypothetical protein n=1 Tax=Xanthomonas TaxID=338 RepID=UPI000067927A|nr:hypothetical protein [Xanthomonas oryzae]AQU46485.1 membrane protein [Xanthomonas oryzae pv. oryzae]AXM14482.1 hypothetical protein BRN32_18670 [Xanthomonas oryzae pv. oryzae]AXM18216.1 hypothetical protein BRN66_18275 [Xanthomonas oryzae pv. oryzae]AXM22075.1 hypothetical protein BRM88_18805 [Xanthomonas oryzae pv. oryzae]AXM25911.1 hypothetical protein BRM77_18485 [Xanthomonas oryzae pv. oryzae]
MNVMVPLVVALSGVPALVIAASIGADDDDRARGLGLRWALISLVILVGAACLYWAGDNRAGIYAVVIGMIIGVNVLIVSMVMHLRRHGSGRDGE